MQNLRKRLWEGWLLLGSLAIDRLSKDWIVLRDLAHVGNRGGIWGMGGDYWIWVSGMGLVGVMVYYLKAKLSWIYRFSLVLLIAGGVGNLYDRVYYGAVVDWIHPLSWFAWFNLADVFINLGLAIIIIDMAYKQIMLKNKI